MKMTKLGHACQLIEEGDARILIDPGAFSSGYEDLGELSAVFVTHQHADHVTPETLEKVRALNPDVSVFADEQSAGMLGDGVKAVHAGDEFEVAGVSVKVLGEQHAIIHPAIPGITNVGYFIAGRYFYPGDSFTQPGVEVEVLALPLGAPWLKVAEVIDYVLAVKPKVAIPVHDAVLAMPDMHATITRNVTKDSGAEIRVVANGSSTEL